MERDTELLYGFKSEVKNILKNFDEVMNATLGDTVTITTGKEVLTRKATLQDTIELYQSEWLNTLELIEEIGIKIEEDNITSITTKVNHKAVHEELQVYADRATANGDTSYLEYKNIQIPYKNICIEDDAIGGSTLIPYMGDTMETSAVAFILLNKDTEYKIIDKIGEGKQPLLIEK